LYEETWLWFQLIIILNGLYLGLRVRREKGGERESERERERERKRERKCFYSQSV
jgi:hypothetical protein